MPLNAFLAEAQLLAADAEIDLFELDTTPIHSVNGVPREGGQIYRWTTGIIDVRSTGTIPTGGTQTTTTVTLDRVLPLIAGRSYLLAVQEDVNAKPVPVAVQSWSVATVSGQSVMSISLALPLPAAAVAGQAWALVGTNSVYFGGQEYKPMPIEVVGYEWSGQGKQPRPKMRVSNIGGFATALLISDGDLLRADVVRLRTRRNFLDDGETPDPTSYCEPDIFSIDRLSAENKNFVEWELATSLDQQGRRLPRRIMVRDTCDKIYRQFITDRNGTLRFVSGTCPYTGGSYFLRDNTPTSDVTKDECGLRLSSCIARFGSAPLPFGGFPGTSVTRL